MGCVSQDYYLRKSFLREEGQRGSNHTVKFSKGTWHHIEIRERKGPSRGIIQKCEPHERSPCAPKFGERSHEETLHQERCARRVAWDLAKIFSSSRIRTKLRFKTRIEERVMLAPTSKRPEEREFVVDSGASMHMMSKKDFSSDELDTLRRSRNTTVVLTANGEVHTNEEAQMYVHDLNLFVTVQLLEETPAVLSLGKLCEDHGYCYEWVSGQKPRLTKEVKTIACKTDNFVPLLFQGYPPVLGAIRRQHRPRRMCLQQVQPKSEVTDQKPKTKKRMTIEIRTTVCEIFPSGWRSSQII